MTIRFESLVPFLGQAMHARYRMPAQVPSSLQGVRLPTNYIGTRWTNCSMFTAWFVAKAFDQRFHGKQWQRWQVADGIDSRSGPRYGPGVVRQWGHGTPIADSPSDGVFLVQYFDRAPVAGKPKTFKGHSLFVLDHDASTGKILTLEANLASTGLDGVGFGDLGPIRSTNAARWRSRVSQTWASRVLSKGEWHAVRLGIDHSTVRTWIAGQQS